MAKPLRILVVDDDVDHALSLGELFALEGHRADVVHSGEEAVEAFANSDHDIAFMDAMLPGKDCVESFLEIRKLKPAARTYMMTGYSIEQLAQRTVETGGLEVLNWPLRPDKVLAALRDTGPCGIILIADADPGIGRELQQILSESDYATEHITERDSVFDIVEERRIHVLILDLKLPLIEGLGVYKTLQAAGRAKPSIILASYPDQAGARGAALDDAAVTGTLTKPFDPRLLLERLETLAA